MPVPAKIRSDALSGLHRVLARVVDLRSEETLAVACGFAYFFCLLCSYYLMRPLRDALGLVGGANRLQWLFTATFITMLALVPVFGMLAARWPPHRFVPLIYRFFALNILGFGALFATGVQELWVSRIFFVWISVFNLFVVSIFWSVLADHFSSEQGRRLFGFIAAGGTAGALAGPALAAVLSVQLGVATLTVLAAGLLELAVRCFRGIALAADAGNAGQQALPLARKPVARDDAIGGSVLGGIMLILKERYLLGIVLYLLLHTFASTFLYFEQGRIVASTLADTASRTRLFAIADFATSCLTIALQLFVTGRLIRRFGVSTALALLPVAGMFAFVGIAAWPTLFMLVAAQSMRRAVDFAVSRPGREVLFTVISREAKYKAKSVIETVVYRGGDAVSAWVFTGLAAAGIGFAGVAALSLPLTACWIWLSAWLARQQEGRAKKAGARAGGNAGVITHELAQRNGQSGTRQEEC
ncbi:NTP/NDP exchange transporter [Noviherbaspirillum massiliense]|uniref:NTP/NDP exchange transporter n=1 Tax=Noviherbaspirillum massiliense TaxID=1465823 RepID=UPI0002ED42F2|nr:hypothetical protein [Noviherbaspirillum massiliense]